MTSSSSSPPPPTGTCLHCGSPSDKIQASCDACHSFICMDCHWCHEFQANHEIRVCDRCDSFLCWNCEDMDQCHDCSEVVCRGCASLLSCKFCGSALCEDCATACAKCGIVLCGRDAKFAVECDTCRLSYCLVCLASGQKETCIRCHHRPSKRMEQLVHLRLKSIYKAFQQSARTNDSHPHKRTAPANDKQTPKIDPDVAKAQADAAAAELLAELELEAAEQMSSNNNNNNSSKTSKSRKKKKKKKKGAATEVNETDQAKNGAEHKPDKPNIPGNGSAPNMKESVTGSNVKQQTCEKEKSKGIKQRAEQGKPKSTQNKDDPTKTPNPDPKEQKPSREKPSLDPISIKLNELVESSDVRGIETLLEEWKGVPGKSALRKNAKKALKKLREQIGEKNGHDRVNEPLIRKMSSSLKTPTTHEVVMEMAPSLVSWDSMLEKEPRIAYVSDEQAAFNDAVRMIETSVKEAEIEAEKTGEVEGLKNGHDQKHPTAGANHAGTETFILPPDDIVSRQMTCEPRFVPLLIGKRGWTIKHIQDESGAKVDIDQTVMPRVIVVTGKPEAVQKATKLVRDVLSYPQAQLRSDENAEVMRGFLPITDNAMNGERDAHTPPPSSLIMTGDIRSVISASSSLSSTPEPSMASSKGKSDGVVPPPGLYDPIRGYVGPELHGQPQRYHASYALSHTHHGFVPPRPQTMDSVVPSGQIHSLHQMQGGMHARIQPNAMEPQQQHHGFGPHLGQSLPHQMPHPSLPMQNSQLGMPTGEVLQRHQMPFGIFQQQHSPSSAPFGQFDGNHVPNKETPSLLFGSGPALLHPPLRPQPPMESAFNKEHDLIASLGLDASLPATKGATNVPQNPGGCVANNSVAQEDSYLVDSMFGPAASDNHTLLPVLHGFHEISTIRVRGNNQSRLPNMQEQTTESRFSWDS